MGFLNVVSVVIEFSFQRTVVIKILKAVLLLNHANSDFLPYIKHLFLKLYFDLCFFSSSPLAMIKAEENRYVLSVLLLLCFMLGCLYFLKVKCSP